MKKYTKPLVLGVVLLLILAAAGGRVRQALRPPPPPPPRTVTARTGDIRVVVQETGTLAPVDKVDVRSKVAGRILSLPIEEGQPVHAGQLIATVDRTQLDPQIAQDQAQLAQAQAHLTQTVAAYKLQLVQTRMAIAQAGAGLETAQMHLAAVAAGPRPPEVAQQRQAIARAQIALNDAERTQRRKRDLAAKGFIPQADADAAQVAVDTARSNLDTARQGLQLTQDGPRPQDIADARSQVDAARVQLETARGNVLQDDVRKSDIAQAQASVAQIVDTLSQLEVNARDTRIVAPASGLVLKKYKQTGEIVQSATTGFSDAQSLVATLGSRLMVQVGINEVDIAKVRQGATVTIQVDAVPGVSFPGVVTEIAPASTNAFSDSSIGGGSSSSISKFNVKVAFEKSDSRLRPGMSAAVTILSQQRRAVVLVPLEAVPFSGDQGGVTVVKSGGGRETRHVVLGLHSERDAEVRQGLRAGETVIVPPLSGTRRTIDLGGGP